MHIVDLEANSDVSYSLSANVSVSRYVTCDCLYVDKAPTTYGNIYVSVARSVIAYAGGTVDIIHFTRSDTWLVVKKGLKQGLIV